MVPQERQKNKMKKAPVFRSGNTGTMGAFYQV